MSPSRSYKVIRITTAPISLKYLLQGQLGYMRSKSLKVIAVSSSGIEWRDIQATEQCRSVIVPMNRQISPIHDFISLCRLVLLFIKERPDIVHSHTPKAGLLAMAAAWIARVPVRIHTVAGLRFMTMHGFWRGLLEFLEKMTGRCATQICPNSPSLYKYLSERGLVSASKMKLIGSGSSNGVDLSRYSRQYLNEQKLSAIKASIQFDENLIYLLSMGRIVRDKGIEETLVAFEKVRQDYPNTRLILLGKMESELDPLTDRTLHLLATLEGIIRVDWSDSPEYYMAIASLLIHASYREGFPSTLLQAGAMGCPILCTDIEGSRDLVKHLGTGLVVPPKDAEAIAAMTCFALTDRSATAARAKRLRQDIEENYDQQVVHRLIYENYLTQLKSKGIE
jgi:glycosyltransferase involved in cell wall biosynthesis